MLQLIIVDSVCCYPEVLYQDYPALKYPTKFPILSRCQFLRWNYILKVDSEHQHVFVYAGCDVIHTLTKDLKKIKLTSNNTCRSHSWNCHWKATKQIRGPV